MSVAKVFKRIREGKMYTQAVMAEKLGVSLPSLKRFEANNVGMPNISTLENLAKIENITTTEVVRNIIFEDRENYSDKLPKYMEYYVAGEYLDGYSYEIWATYRHKYVGLREYEALLTKKREIDNRVLLDRISDLPRHYYVFGDNEKLSRIVFDKIVEVDSLQKLPKIKEYRFVEDFHSEFSTEVFEAMTKIHFSVIKMPVSMVLYDYKKQEVIKKHYFNKVVE